MNNLNQELSAEARQALMATLQARFEKHISRHAGLVWAQVQARLEGQAHRLWSLNEMESSGGEPDVVARDEKTGEVIFYDCAAETPAGRRNLCYDQAALEGRKKFPPADSAMAMSARMGIELLSEEQYRHLQQLGKFDLKTSSWLLTPPEIRKLGGAIFGDRRYNHIFVYHNGADSYYAARGFRGVLRL